jgi:hypothetical protein
MKVITGAGLKKSKERGVYDKETKKLSVIYYNPKQGYSGINDLVRKSGLKQKEVKKILYTVDTYTLD